MTLWVNVLAKKPKDLYSVLESMWYQNKINWSKIFSDYHTCAIAYKCPHINTDNPKANA